MNVLIVTHFDDAVGGVASVTGNLARHLERKGHRPVFFLPGTTEHPTRVTTAWGFTGYRQNLRAPWISAHPFRSIIAFLAYLPRTLYQLHVLLRAEAIDVVNVHYPLDGHISFALFRALRRIRLVVSVHGAEVFPNGQRSASYSWALRTLLRLADVIVAPSRAFLRDLLAVFPSVTERAVAVHNGIDLDEFPVPAPLPARSHAPTVLCIAAHNSKKAIDVLLQAFAAVRRAYPSAQLQLVGDGPLRGQLERLAQELALGGSVAFLGACTRGEVDRLLNACHVFVLPSRAEPFGLVVVEAMAHGRPVVASAVGGITEIIDHGTTGLLVPPDDPEALAQAVLQVLSDEPLAKALAARGQARARAEFSCERTGSQYERLYARLVAGRHLDPRAIARSYSAS